MKNVKKGTPYFSLAKTRQHCLFSPTSRRRSRAQLVCRLYHLATASINISNKDFTDNLSKYRYTVFILMYIYHHDLDCLNPSYFSGFQDSGIFLRRTKFCPLHRYVHFKEIRFWWILFYPTLICPRTTAGTGYSPFQFNTIINFCLIRNEVIGKISKYFGKSCPKFP